MDLASLVLSYLRYVAISITLMFLGVLVLGMVYELGISRILCKPFRSLMLLARLPPDLAVLIPAAVVDVKVEQAYLSELRTGGVVGDDVVIAYVLPRRPFTLITHLIGTTYLLCWLLSEFLWD